MSAPLYREVDGQVSLSAAGLALTLGVTEADVVDSIREQGEPANWVVPEEWLRQGRRITREAQAATGSTSITTVVDHLAAQAAR